jgi:hypothetical protein
MFHSGLRLTFARDRVIGRRSWPQVLMLAVLAFGLQTLADSPVGAVEFSVQGISVSSGGAFLGTHALIPVGGSVSIGARIGDLVSESILATGASYYGYDSSVVTYVSGSAVDSIFHDTCVPGPGPVGGVANLVQDPLVETDVGPGGPLVGTLHVPVLVAASFDPVMIPVGDAGLDGECGGGDAQFRLTFEGISEGETTLTIGTGDDADGILILSAGIVQATNATVTITVPEPEATASLACGMLLLIGLAAIGRHQR